MKKIFSSFRANPILRAGFTLVELLIVVAILAVLSGAAYIGIQRSQERVMNEKMMDDLQAISNALEQFRQDEGAFPNLTNGFLKVENDKNVNCFKSDSSYEHECGVAAFMQTFVDNNLLTKRYLQEVPKDPRTGSRYVYGVSQDGQYYQVAGLYQDDEGVWSARVVGNLEQGYELPSVIRAYDGPNFVMDKQSYLPYSPDYLSITATVDAISGSVTIEGSPAVNGNVVKAGETIMVQKPGSAILYFSDGSVTNLDATDDDVQLRLLPNSEAVDEGDKGVFTKIKLKLFKGKIWNKVARLASESEFNVETTSAIAGVRGTEFGIDGGSGEIVVLSGAVASRQIITGEDELIGDGGEETYVDFSKGVFKEDQEAESDGTFRVYAPQANNGAILEDPYADVNEDDYIEKYYPETPTNNIRPRVLKLDVPAGNITFTAPALIPEALEISTRNNEGVLEDITKWSEIDLAVDMIITPKTGSNEKGMSELIDTLEDRESNQVWFRFIYGTADTGLTYSQYTTVGIPLANGLVLEEDDIYTQQIAEASEGDEAGDEAEVVDDGGSDDSQNDSFQINSPKTYYTVGENINTQLTIDGDVMPGIDITMPGTTPVITDLNGSASITLPSDPGVYEISASAVGTAVNSITVTVCQYTGTDGDECWVMGEPGLACQGDGVTAGVCDGIGLSCASGDWNDTVSSAICLDIMQDEYPDTGGSGTNSNNYAPFWLDDTDTQNCTPRGLGKPVACDAPPPQITGLTFQRLCMCQ